MVAAPKRPARTGSPSSMEEFESMVVVSRDMVPFSLLCLVLSLSLVVSLLTWGGEPLISEFDDLRWQQRVQRWPSMKDWRGMKPGWEKFRSRSAWRGQDLDLSDDGANGDHDSWVFGGGSGSPLATWPVAKASDGSGGYNEGGGCDHGWACDGGSEKLVSEVSRYFGMAAAKRHGRRLGFPCFI